MKRHKLSTTTLTVAAMLSIHVSLAAAQDSTDHAGEFSLSGLATGEHIVYLMRAGYAPGMVQFTLPENLAGQIDVGVVVLSRGLPPYANLTGTVVDAQTNQPVPGANVALNGQTGISTNVLGAFRIPTTQVNWGINVLEVQRIGYAPMKTELWVAQQQTDLDLDVTLVPSATPLAEVVVEGERATYVPGLTPEFYRRRRVGFGSFFDKREIETISPRVVTDIVRRAPGISVQSGAHGNNTIVFLRSIKSCQPLLFLNGARVSKADDVDWLLSPDVILGIELYQGAQVPTEFNQTDSAFGIVVIWTK